MYDDVAIQQTIYSFKLDKILDFIQLSGTTQCIPTPLD